MDGHFHLNLQSISHILICEDHPFAQIGLELSLRQILPQLRSVSFTSFGEEALKLVKEKLPSLVIVDIGLPDMSGVDLVKALREFKKNLPIIVVTSCDQPSLLIQLQHLKVAAIMQKASSIEHLRTILQQLEDGATKTILDSKVKNLISDQEAIEFTPKEYEILQEIIQGKTNHQIAEKLGCAITTIRFHRSNIMSKTNIHNAAELTAWYLQGQRKRH